MRTRSIATATAIGLALATAGCGASSQAGGGGTSSAAVNPNGAEVSPAGDIPDNQAYVAYAPPGEGYSVKVPEGWARTTAGGATTFTDKLNSIRMESMPAAAAPGKVAGATTSTVARSAGTAVRTAFIAQSKADPVTGKVHSNAVERYVFLHKGRAIVLTLTGPKGADNVDPWKIVTDSLRFTA
ncbi:MAG: hypothetical protein JWM73_2323 [Solirubrobacterales bacterium]|nr:hypothetical protein [Solirubrobacterales bacterium]